MVGSQLALIPIDGLIIGLPVVLIGLSIWCHKH
jgi:hypothetical protein